MRHRGASVILFYAIIGSFYTVVEILAYIYLYSHISAHNIQIGVEMLDVSVIKQRNKVNAASLTGLIACWLMEVFHIVFVGFLTLLFENNSVREFSALFKYFQFYLIPFVEVHTSPAIQRFISSNH